MHGALRGRRRRSGVDPDRHLALRTSEITPSTRSGEYRLEVGAQNASNLFETNIFYYCSPSAAWHVTAGFVAPARQLFSVCKREAKPVGIVVES
jgi:hypothetical protein